MSATLNHPEPTLNSGDNFSGFKVLRVETIPALRITAYEIEHEKTGARILHLHSFDRENLYVFALRLQILPACRIFWNTLFWPAQKNIR